MGMRCPTLRPVPPLSDEAKFPTKFPARSGGKVRRNAAEREAITKGLATIPSSVGSFGQSCLARASTDNASRRWLPVRESTANRSKGSTSDSGSRYTGLFSPR